MGRRDGGVWEDVGVLGRVSVCVYWCAGIQANTEGGACV